MGAFLAARRLARADDLVTPIRLVVAAAVVGSLALSGAVSVNGWTGEQAARRGARRPHDRRHRARRRGRRRPHRARRPRGRRTSSPPRIVRNEDRLGERRAYVDADRWDAVVGDFYDGTPAPRGLRRGRRAAHRRRPVPGARATGSRVTASGLDGARGRAPQRARRRGRRASAAAARGDPALRHLGQRLRCRSRCASEVPPGRHARHAARSGCRECAEGCTVTGLDVGRDSQGLIDDSDFEVLLERLALGDTDLLAPAVGARPGSVRVGAQQQLLPQLRAARQPRGQPARRPPGRAAARRSRSRSSSTTRGGRSRCWSPTRTSRSGARPRRRRPHDRRRRRRRHAAAARQRRPALRHPHLRRRLRADRPLRRGAGRRRRRHPAGDARRGRRGHRLVVAHPRARCATRSASATAAPSPWRTPSRPSPARSSRCWRWAPGVARHLRDYRRDVASLRVLGVSARHRPPRRPRRAGQPHRAGAGHRRGRRLAGRHAAPRRPPAARAARSPALPLDTAPHAWPLVVPAVLSAARGRAGRRSRPRRPRAPTTRPSLLREEEGPRDDPAPRRHRPRPALARPALGGLGAADRARDRVGGARPGLLRGGHQLLRRDPPPGDRRPASPA